MSERGEYDSPEEDEENGEEEEGECSDTSEEENEEVEGEDDDENCDPTGLFDALAAAHEAEERYRQSEAAVGTSEEDRLEEDAIVSAFKEAITGGWHLEEEEGEEEEEEEIEADWKVGDRCLAIFSEDGESYKAKIILLKHWRSAAVVQFVDYGNQEEVKFENLSPYKRAKVRN